MRNRLLVIVFSLFLISTFGIKVLAANPERQDKVIIIDGKFNDWEGLPYVEDPKNDIGTTWLDFTGVKYFADDKYLYLKVDRLSASSSNLWNFSIAVLNGTKGVKHFQYIKPPLKMVFAPQFDITSYRIYGTTIVVVSIDGKILESTFSAGDNGKEIEFRLPLEKVGLDGPNREVEFILKSHISEKGEIDWMPNKNPIIITTGPTFWQLSTIVIFIVVSFGAYKVYKRNGKKVD